MKKLFICLVGVAAMTFTATAQEKAVWGVRAGMNVTNITAKVGNQSQSFDSRVGYNVGVSYQQPLVSKLFLETGLNFTSRGANFKASALGANFEDAKVKGNLMYLQIPVAISWHFDAGNFSIQPAVGVYYGLGVSGKLKTGEGEMKMFKKETIGEDELPQTLKRSDFGMRFGVGVAIHKHYYVGLGYDLGLTNIVKKNGIFDGTNLKNGSFYISLGYNF